MWFRRKSIDSKKHRQDLSDPLGTSADRAPMRTRGYSSSVSSGNIYDTPNMLKFPSRGRMRRRKNEIRR